MCDAVDRFKGDMKKNWLKCMMALDPFPGGIIGMSALDKMPDQTPLGTSNNYLGDGIIQTIES
jgi:hypothetical protein